MIATETETRLSLLLVEKVQLFFCLRGKLVHNSTHCTDITTRCINYVLQSFHGGAAPLLPSRLCTVSSLWDLFQAVTVQHSDSCHVKHSL